MKQTQLPFLLSSMAAFAMVGGGLSPLALAAQNSDKLQLVQTGPGNLAKTKIYGARKINDHCSTNVGRKSPSTSTAPTSSDISKTP